MREIIKSKIIPLPREDIDTDLIIPADFLTTTSKKGLGEHVFARLRMMESNFPFNLAKYREAKILVAGKNFGCGSSREHAAWALRDWGIEVVIAPSFADIFFNNAMKNGILPIILDEKIVSEIFAKEDCEIEVNVAAQKVILPNGEVFNFEIDSYRKECLLKDMDDLAYLVSQMSEIKSFDKRHSKNIFFDTKVL
ncbi:MAG: 3-isopropylmalate dehydratase small subunit [Candidatus Peregrinibacteria bacterium]|nr:3-isopropylmalate dehydratase small subunit [Candidatus Peregrinibacteria bacterium]